VGIRLKKWRGTAAACLDRLAADPQSPPPFRPIDIDIADPALAARVAEFRPESEE